LQVVVLFVLVGILFAACMFRHRVDIGRDRSARPELARDLKKVLSETLVAIRFLARRALPGTVVR
jgi:hypothetical protein